MRPRFPFVLKFIAVLVCVIAVPVGALVGGSVYLQKTFRADTEQKIETTLGLAMNMEESLINERLLSMEHIAAAVATDKSVVTATVRPGSRPELGPLAERYPLADLILVVDREGVVVGRSTSEKVGDTVRLDGLIRKAIMEEKALAYPALISPEEMRFEGESIREQVAMPIVATAGSSDQRGGTKLETALALVGIFPIYGPETTVSGAVVAADILNRDYAIVDEVAQRSPAEIPLNATIALDGIRVTTNVRLTDPETGHKSEQRALGTLYSDVVMSSLRANQDYRGRAPVVGQWQRTIYRPLRDYQGRVIAGPYVGIPEEYFTGILNDVTRSVRVVMALVAAGLALVIGLAAWWAYLSVAAPVRRLAAQLRARDFSTPPEHPTSDEIAALTAALGEVMAEVTGALRQVKELAAELEESAAGLRFALSETAEDAVQALAAVNGSLQVSRELQNGAGETAARLEQLAESVTATMEGARRQGRSVQYAGRVTTEIAVALQESKERVDRAIEGTGNLTAAARACLRRVAEFTAGMALLQRRLAPENNSGRAMELLQDPSDVLVNLANTAEQIADEVRFLALTIQENQARLAFIHEEMKRVDGVVEATAERTQQAGAATQTVTERLGRILAGAGWVASAIEATHASVESITAAQGRLAEMAERAEQRARQLRETAERVQ